MSADNAAALTGPLWPLAANSLNSHPTGSQFDSLIAVLNPGAPGNGDAAVGTPTSRTIGPDFFQEYQEDGQVLFASSDADDGGGGRQAAGAAGQQLQGAIPQPPSGSGVLSGAAAAAAAGAAVTPAAVAEATAAAAAAAAAALAAAQQQHADHQPGPHPSAEGQQAAAAFMPLPQPPLQQDMLLVAPSSRVGLPAGYGGGPQPPQQLLYPGLSLAESAQAFQHSQQQQQQQQQPYMMFPQQLLVAAVPPPPPPHAQLQLPHLQLQPQPQHNLPHPQVPQPRLPLAPPPPPQQQQQQPQPQPQPQLPLPGPAAPEDYATWALDACAAIQGKRRDAALSMGRRLLQETGALQQGGGGQHLADNLVIPNEPRESVVFITKGKPKDSRINPGAGPGHKCLKLVCKGETTLHV